MLLLFITALALSVDGFAAGAAFGLRGVKIGVQAKTAIAFLSAGFAAISVLAGGAIGAVIPPRAGLWLGAVLLICLGAAAAIRSILPPSPPKAPKAPMRRRFHALGLTILVIREPEEGDLDHSGAIDLKEALLLGLSLSVDMLGAGIGLALTGVGSLWLPPVVGLVQTACLAFGEFTGRQMTQLPLGKHIFGLLSGILLMALGAARLLL